MPKANLTIEGTTPVDADARYDARYDGKGDLWVNPKDPIYGAVGDGSANDTAEVQAALTDLPNFTGYTGGARMYLPPGDFLVDASLSWPAGLTDVRIEGAGKHVTWFTIADGANVPIFDISTQERFVFRNIGFRTLTPTSHASSPPLLKFTRGYLGLFEAVAFWKPSGVAVYYEGQTVTGQALIGDVPTWRDCFFATGGTGTNHLLHLHNVNNYTVETSDFENTGTGKAAIFDEGLGLHQWHQGLIRANHFENNPSSSGSGYGIFLKRAWGVSIRDNWFDDSHVYLDEESSNNWVQHNEFAGNGQIVDAGWDNHIGPNDGRVYNPKPGIVSVFFPSSHTSDPDESSRTASQFWTGATYNGGTGSIAKDFYRALTPTIEAHAGRIPLRVSPNGANGYSARQDIVVAPGDTYWLDAYFFPEGNPGAVRILLQDAAGPTTFYDSGALSRTYANDVTEYRPFRHQAVVRIPSGVTSCRVLIASENVNIVWVERIRLVKTAIVNGGMEAPTGYAYAGGVASGWTGSGTGAPSQEATIVKSGSAAQEIACDAGEAYWVSQSPTIDSNRFYYLQAWMRVDTGLATRAQIGWGTDLTSTIASQFILSQQETSVWRAVTKVFRPNSLASLIFGVTSDATLPATAYFDNVILLPLKEAVAEKDKTSPNIDLSGAAVSHAVIFPTIDMRLRAATIGYTEASSADAGVAVRVGTYANNTYFASATSAVSQAQGTQTAMTLTKTDIRAGTPIVVSCAGGKTGAGELQVSLEYDA
jgi:hypothetical protein